MSDHNLLDKIYDIPPIDTTIEAYVIRESKPVRKPIQKIVWKNVILFLILHMAAIYGVYLYFTKATWTTILWTSVVIHIGGLGITAGAHRLWAHKSFRAKLPLRVMLVIFNTVALQGSVIIWCRDHRMHHKYTETDADPHNSNRGFFFAHVGWLLMRKHPDIMAKGNTVELDDLWSDPLLRFQHKYFMLLFPIFGIFLPIFIPTLWGETLLNAFFVSGVFRYVYSLNGTWLVNSAAHIWGNKPYDKNINPSENTMVSIIALGEGFHNYHHVYPWDYKTSELPYLFNFTTFFIDVMAKIGWAYDLKRANHKLLERKVRRTGDGTHKIWGDVLSM